MDDYFDQQLLFYQSSETNHFSPKNYLSLSSIESKSAI